MKNLFLHLVCSIFYTATLPAQQIDSLQWENLSLPPTGILDLVEQDGRLFAVDGNLYYSDDMGETWVRHPQFLFDDLDNVVAGDFGVMVNRRRPSLGATAIVNYFVSADGGNTFEEYLPGFQVGHFNYGQKTNSGLIKKSESTVVALETYRSANWVYRLKLSVSDNAGMDWAHYEKPEWHELPNRPSTDVYQDTFVLSFLLDSTNWRVELFADDFDHPYVDTLPLPMTGLTGMAYYNGQFFSYSETGDFYVTSNYGNSWIPVILPFDDAVEQIDKRGNAFFCHTPTTIWKIPFDNLENISPVYDKQFPHNNIWETESGLFISNRSGVYGKPHGDSTFAFKGQGISSYIDKMHSLGNRIYVNTKETPKPYINRYQWWESDDFGESWRPLSDSILRQNHIHNLVDFDTLHYLISTNRIFVAIPGGNWQVIPDMTGAGKLINSPTGVFYYTDTELWHATDGIHFSLKNRPLEEVQITWYAEGLYVFDEHIRYASFDFGETWEEDEILYGNGEGEKYVFGDVLVNLHQIGNSATELTQSFDHGLTWKSVHYLQNPYIHCNLFDAKVYYFDGELMVISDGNFLKATRSAGDELLRIIHPIRYQQWASLDGYWAEFTYESPRNMWQAGEYLFACSENQGLFRTPYLPIYDMLSDTISEKGIIFFEENVDLCNCDIYQDEVYTEHTTLTRVGHHENFDTIFTTHIQVWPTYLLDTLITLHPGDTFNGIPIFSDTTFTHQHLTINGCDSIVHYQFNILTSNNNLTTSGIETMLQPNPTDDHTTLLIKTVNAITLSLDVYTATGQRLKTVVANKLIPAGREGIPVPMRDLPAGVYWLHLTSDAGAKVLRVVRR